MNNQTVNYFINITGNANEVVNNIKQNAVSLNKTLSGTLNIFSGIKGSIVAFQGLTSIVQNVQSAIGGITEVGANAELQLMNMKTLFQGNSEAAAAKEGSAELPQIKQALNQDVLFVRSRRSRFEPEE